MSRRATLVALTVAVVLSASERDVHAQQPPSVDDVLTGKFSPSRHPAFTRYGGFHIRQDVLRRYNALQRCAADRECSGLDRSLRVTTCSMFRPYRRQKSRWLAKMKSRRALWPNPGRRVESLLRYLAIPGTSRHHWGTDIDISFDGRCKMANFQYMTAAENTRRCQRERERCRRVGKSKKRCDKSYTFCFKRDGKGVQFYRWMRENAGRFGLCQPYKGFPEQRNGERFTRGYEPERWHWSSCCEAKRFYERFRTRLSQLTPPPADVFGKEALRHRRRRGYLSNLHRTMVVDAVRQHVLNIHPDCLDCKVDCSASEVPVNAP